MKSIITTPRLKLTLVTTAEKGSQELDWIHELRSNEKATFWSIMPRSLTLSDTEKHVKNLLPSPDDDTANPRYTYKLNYLVHAYDTPENTTTTLIGIVRIYTLTPPHLPPTHLILPEHLTFTEPTPSSPTILATELGYMFLPSSWGKGYATEAVNAVIRTVREEGENGFWKPWEKVHLRAIVNDENPGSQRVMAKIEGMEKRGLYEWKGDKVFVGGEWKVECGLWIFGGWIVG